MPAKSVDYDKLLWCGHSMDEWHQYCLVCGSTREVIEDDFVGTNPCRGPRWQGYASMAARETLGHPFGDDYGRTRPYAAVIARTAMGPRHLSVWATTATTASLFTTTGTTSWTTAPYVLPGKT